MSVQLQGERELIARLNAIANVAPRALLGQLAIAAVREQKLLVHRKTGTTARTIHVGRVTTTYAETIVGGAGRWLEEGTRAHLIRPRNRRALAWPASAGGARLSGSARVGARRGKFGGMVVRKLVHHPGTKAYPFMVPGARKALEGAAIANVIVRAWNDAA